MPGKRGEIRVKGGPGRWLPSWVFGRKAPEGICASASRGSLTCPSSVTGFIELGVSTGFRPGGPVEQAARAQSSHPFLATGYCLSLS